MQKEMEELQANLHHPEPEITFKYGLVAVLDALGVSGYRTDEAQRFLQNRNGILAEIRGFVVPYLKSLHADFGKTVQEPEIFTFGDTIIFAWEMKNNQRSFAGAAIAADYIRAVLVSGILRKVMFRGAMSLGRYVTDKTTILGPAVSDAAAWYNAADWIGVVATPTLSFTLEFMTAPKNAAEVMLPRFLRCAVPLKGNRTEAMWAVSWPYEFEAKWQESGKAFFANCLEPTATKEDENIVIPMGVETKYINAFKFYDAYILETKKTKPISLRCFIDLVASPAVTPKPAEKMGN